MSEHKQVNPWIVAVAVMFATFMEVLDTTVVNVSLPHIAGSLSATIDESTWVLTSYLVANAIILPMTGWLARNFGRKRLLMMSVSGFTISSLLCGLAPNLPLLVMFRLIQGATGGAMQPLSQAILLEAFPPDQRGKAMGFWGLGIVVAPILGPVLGGWLTDTYSWRWVFYINLPVGIASLVMTQLYIFDPSYLRQETAKIDYWGIGLLALWIGSLQIALDLGQEHDWFSSRFITMLVVIAAAWPRRLHRARVDGGGTDRRSACLQGTHVQRRRPPDDHARVRAIRQHWCCCRSCCRPCWATRRCRRGSPWRRAAWARCIGMPMVGMLIGKLDSRKLVAVGLTTGAATLFWLGTPEPQRRLLGFLLAAVLPGPRPVGDLRAPDDHQHGQDRAGKDGQRDQPVQPDAQSWRQHRHRGHGTASDAQPAGLRQRLRQRTSTHTRRRRSGRSTAARSGFIAGGSDLTTATQQAYAALFGMVNQQASMVSFVTVFRLLGVMFLLLLPLVLVMKRPRSGAAPPGAH